MEYDYFPEEQTEDSLKIDENCIVIHPTENWPNRTWPLEHWQRLVDLIKTHTDMKVVMIGKAHREHASNEEGHIVKGLVKLDGVDYKVLRQKGGWWWWPRRGSSRGAGAVTYRCMCMWLHVGMGMGTGTDTQTAPDPWPDPERARYLSVARVRLGCGVRVRRLVCSSCTRTHLTR